jgi:hypothetical protein
MINTMTTLTKEDVITATKCSNFNKRLGPDCFDRNMLRSNVELHDKIVAEITDALNDMRIPEYLRTGRLVPLQKNQPKDLLVLMRSGPSWW